MTFPDFRPAPNQGGRTDLYELENQAIDPDGLVLAAMRELAPWDGRTLVDLGDASVDVMHARFAYFWPPRCAAGLTEVLRVLRPGGTLVVVDNDQRAGKFAGLLRAARRRAGMTPPTPGGPRGAPSGLR
jgi:hypothetical protein